MDVYAGGVGLGGQLLALEGVPSGGSSGHDSVGHDVDGGGDVGAGEVVVFHLAELVHSEDDEEGCGARMGAGGGIDLEVLGVEPAVVAQEVAQVLHAVVRHHLVGLGVEEVEACASVGLPAGDERVVDEGVVEGQQRAVGTAEIVGNEDVAHGHACLFIASHGVVDVVVDDVGGVDFGVEPLDGFGVEGCAQAVAVADRKAGALDLSLHDEGQGAGVHAPRAGQHEGVEHSSEVVGPVAAEGAVDVGDGVGLGAVRVDIALYSDGGVPSLRVAELCEQAAVGVAHAGEEAPGGTHGIDVVAGDSVGYEVGLGLVGGGAEAVAVRADDDAARAQEREGRLDVHAGGLRGGFDVARDGEVVAEDEPAGVVRAGADGDGFIVLEDVLGEDERCRQGDGRDAVGGHAGVGVVDPVAGHRQEDGGVRHRGGVGDDFFLGAGAEGCQEEQDEEKGATQMNNQIIK